jgi:hypothetical protein
MKLTPLPRAPIHLGLPMVGLKHVRAIADGIAVADMAPPFMVWEHHRYPWYFTPIDTIRGDLIPAGAGVTSRSLGVGEPARRRPPADRRLRIGCQCVHRESPRAHVAAGVHAAALRARAVHGAGRAGLGQDEIDQLAALIKQLKRQCAILIVEHHVDFVSEISDQVYVLNFGKVIASGDFNTVKRDPAVVAAYLGTNVDGQEIGGSHA